MSNAVDILVVGGVDDGLVLCQPRPVPATIEHKGVTYTIEIHDQRYVARFDPEDASDVDAALLEAGMVDPSWDLR